LFEEPLPPTLNSGSVLWDHPSLEERAGELDDSPAVLDGLVGFVEGQNVEFDTFREALLLGGQLNGEWLFDRHAD
jgi:hypothetical protein